MGHENHKHRHDYLLGDHKIAKNEKKTVFVVILTFVTMIVEITAGHLTGSMALLADGWHMASHAGALGISVVAYRLAKSGNLNKKLSFGAGKFIPLGGYTSAIVLALVAILMGFNSIERLFSPVSIHFNEAISVAVLGLVVNIVSAVILFDKHHHHHGDGHRHDHNIRSAYIHVIADALTSVLAIVALIFGKIYGASWLDPVMGIVGAVVILRWAYLLSKETVWELLDGHAKAVNHEEVKSEIENMGVEVSDLHIWRIAPNALACELVVFCDEKRGTERFREKLESKFQFKHLIVEERQCVHA